MEKESCTKFCGVLVRFYKFLKLQSFEFSISGIIPANVQIISPLVFSAFFVGFIEKVPPIKFYTVFDHFSRTYDIAKF